MSIYVDIIVIFLYHLESHFLFESTATQQSIASDTILHYFLLDQDKTMMMMITKMKMMMIMKVMITTATYNFTFTTTTLNLQQLHILVTKICVYKIYK